MNEKKTNAISGTMHVVRPEHVTVERQTGPSDLVRIRWKQEEGNHLAIDVLVSLTPEQAERLAKSVMEVLGRRLLAMSPERNDARQARADAPEPKCHPEPTLPPLMTDCEECLGRGAVEAHEWTRYWLKHGELMQALRHAKDVRTADLLNAELTHLEMPDTPEEVTCPECEGTGKTITEAGTAILHMVNTVSPWKE